MPATPVRRAIEAVVMALALAACSIGAVPTPDPAVIAVPTQPPQPSGTPAACMASSIDGRLVADERWGVALVDGNGTIRKVIWPNGYSARRDIAHVALLDPAGAVVAVTGQDLHIEGGETGSDGTWLACGAIRLNTPV
jgi:hypothetical protein